MTVCCACEAVIDAATPAQGVSHGYCPGCLERACTEVEAIAPAPYKWSAVPSAGRAYGHAGPLDQKESAG